MKAPHIEEAEACPVTQSGRDTSGFWAHLTGGATYSAPCGWATYNRYDIDHYTWHRLGYAKPPESKKEQG